VRRGSRPAVDFFLRNLTYEFARDDIVGLPGSMIGLEAPLQDDRLIGFLHEAEHVTQLMYPLGTLMTALGLRVLDLRNDAARAVKAQEFFPLAKAIDRYGDCVFSIHLFAEWVKPLMEGLALVSEMELDPFEGDVISRGFAAALAVDAAQWRQKFLRSQEGMAILQAIAAGEINIVDDVRPQAERQIAIGRELRIEGDMIDDVFWGSGGDGTLPYFIGYLFFKRLEQEWRARVPSLTPRDVHELATVAFCSVLPLAVLPFFDAGIDIERKRPSYELAAAMQYMIDGLPRLSAESIGMLSIRERMLRFDGSLNVVSFVDLTGMDGRERLARLLSPIIVHVFGTNDRAHLAQTADVLRELEYAKPIVPVAVREVTAVATAADGAVLLLIDAAADLTFFECDAAGLKELAAKCGADVAKLPHVRLGEAPYRLSIGNAPWRLMLVTYLHFWPNGVNDGEAVRPLQMLLTTGGETLFESGANDDDIDSRRVRDFANVRYAKFVAEAIDGKLGPLGAIVDRLEPLAGDELERMVANRLTEIYRPETLDTIRDDIRTRFSHIVFGDGVDHARIRRERWSIMADDLAVDDVAILRRALRNGLVFSRHNFALAPGAREAVARIRAAALRRLGIPLVRWCDSPLGIALDVVPA